MSDDAWRYPLQYARAAAGHMVTASLTGFMHAPRRYAPAWHHVIFTNRSTKLLRASNAVPAAAARKQKGAARRSGSGAAQSLRHQSTASCQGLHCMIAMCATASKGPRFPRTRRPCKLATDSVASTHRDHGAQRAATGAMPKHDHLISPTTEEAAAGATKHRGA